MSLFTTSNVKCMWLPLNEPSYLVKNYPQAPSAQKALVVMYEANKALGLNKAAEDAMAVYKATYHTSNMIRINS